MVVAPRGEGFHRPEVGFRLRVPLVLRPFAHRGIAREEGAGLDLQAQGLGHVFLDRWVDVGVGADGARDGAGGDVAVDSAGDGPG